MNNFGKGLATVAAAGLCAYCMYVTKSATGIGWFIVAVLFIW